MTTTLDDLPIDQVHPNPANPRDDLGDLTELAASIKDHGILEPVIVAPCDDGYVLIAGHRRRAAAELAGAKTIPGIVRHDLVDSDQWLAAALIENLHRSDLTPVEEAHAYQALLAFPGYTVKKVAAATGRPVRTVQLRIGLTKLPDKVLAKVQARQITLEDATVLAAFAKKPDQLKQLERAVGTPNFAYTVQRIKQDAEREKRREKILADLKATGVTVLPATSGYRYNQTLRYLGLHQSDHEACPGHAATLQTYDNTPVFLCQDPDKYGHTPAEQTTGQPAESTEDRDKRMATLEEERAARAAALAVRQAFVTDALDKPTSRTLDAFAPLVAAWLSVGSMEIDYKDIGPLLGVTLPDDVVSDDWDAIDAWWRTTMTSWDHKRLYAVTVAAAASDLTPERWAEHAVLYFEALASAGYELSDYDQALLAAASQDDDDVEDQVDEAAAG